MENLRPCDKCGELIYFIRNSDGKFVPMSYKTDKPHYPDCKPYKSKFDFKHKMYDVNEISKNQKLTKFEGGNNGT